MKFLGAIKKRLKTYFTNMLDEFIKEQKAIYGPHFFLEQTDDKIVVMTEKLAEKLRDQINASSKKIVSYDKDGTIGSYFRVKLGKTVKLRHYHRDSKEMDRLLNNLGDTKMISLEREGTETVMTNELMAGELFRGVVPAGHNGWLVVAVDHEFEDRAPKVLGWLKIDENITPVKTKEFYKPKKLRAFNEVIKNLIGLPYHLGGKSEGTGYDCSSMIQKIFFDTKGIWLPKLASWQEMVAEPIKENELIAGDLLFFSHPPDEKVEHVAIFVGDKKILHASPFHKKITIEPLSEELFNRGYKIMSYGRF